MLPGQGDLLMREWDRQDRLSQEANAECKQCDAATDKRTLSHLGLCPDCQAHLHPFCGCGCGEEARLVAEVRWPGGIDCRAPWVDIEHALASVSEHTPDRPSIDVVVDSHDFQVLLRLVDRYLAPCWCGVRLQKCFKGYEYRTRLPWCPCHGAKE